MQQLLGAGRQGRRALRVTALWSLRLTSGSPLTPSR